MPMFGGWAFDLDVCKTHRPSCCGWFAPVRIRQIEDQLVVPVAKFWPEVI